MTTARSCESHGISPGILSITASSRVRRFRLPVTCCDSLRGTDVAVDRKNQSGKEEGANQIISLLEAIKLYAWNGTYASFEGEINALHVQMTAIDGGLCTLMKEPSILLYGGDERGGSAEVSENVLCGHERIVFNRFVPGVSTGK